MKIYLPNDADGNVIPSNVKVMYEKDGSVVRVNDLVHGIVSKKWRVQSGHDMFNPSQLYLNKHDSLEQLAADLDRLANNPEMAACTYLNRDRGTCIGCKYQKHFIYLNEWTMYTVEQIDSTKTDKFNYEFNFLPQELSGVKITSKE